MMIFFVTPTDEAAKSRLYNAINQDFLPVLSMYPERAELDGEEAEVFRIAFNELTAAQKSRFASHVANRRVGKRASIEVVSEVREALELGAVIRADGYELVSSWPDLFKEAAEGAGARARVPSLA